MKEEKENLLQEKDKLRRMVEMEIEWQKEKIQQQKERGLGTLSKKPTVEAKNENLDKLHQDHKQLEAEHKKLGSDFDRQQVKLKQVQMENKGIGGRKKDGCLNCEDVGRSGEGKNTAHHKVL